MMNRVLTILVMISLSFVNDIKAFHPLATDDEGHVTIKVNNVVNGNKLQLNTTQYVNQDGESFTVRLYKYYISNIKLVKDNGGEYTEAESYHLVNEAKSRSKEFKLNDVPAGRYTAISFMIGVDSLHNVSGAQSGELDPINAMFWDWNTGYIMAKMEGYTPNNMSGEEITFHIGGFEGKHNVLRNVVLKLPGDGLNVSATNNTIINLQSDLAEWFKTPNKVKFSKTPVVTIEGKEAAAIADNYADMFTIKSIED